jgi:hypothetical protein
MQDMCTKAARNGSITILSNFAALFLTIWHRTHGDVAECRRYARIVILECPNQLSDEDLANDTDAYRMLVSGLVAAGEDDHAVAIARFIRPQRRSFAFYLQGSSG